MDFTSASQDYIDCGVLASDLNIDGVKDKTIMGWANCHNFSASTEGCPFKIGTTDAADEFFGLRVTSTTSQWRADFWDTWIQFTTNTTSENVWWHFAITYDGTTARVYANGEEEGTSVITLDTTDGFNLYIGLWDQGTGGATIDFFDGEVQDVRVYDRQLSEAEIQSIYMAEGKDGIVNGLQCRYPLTDGTITSSPASTFVADTATSVSSAASITLTVPSNTDGDLLVACVCSGGDATGVPANTTTPSGWTFITSVDAPTAGLPYSNTSIWVYEREASSEPANYVFSIDQTCTITGHMNCYQNVTTSNDVSGTNSGLSTSADSPSVTFTDANGSYLVVRFGGADNGALGSDPWGLGINQRNLIEETGVGNGCGLICGDNIKSGTTAGIKSFALASDQWCTATIAFKAQPSIKDVSGSANHPHDADPQFTVSRTTGTLRI